MKGFCSGHSIEIDLDLDENEVSKLEREVVNGSIRFGHDNPKKSVDVYLKLGNTGSEPLMILECLPKGTDFEGITGYDIILSSLAYEYLHEQNCVVDRPGVGNKVTITKILKNY